MTTGSHTFIYVAPNLPAGFYFVEMKVDGQTTVKRVVKPSATNSIKTITANANRINVFPNPNSGTITLQSNSELGLITIYNDFGELIYQQTINENKTQVDLNQYAKGIYFVKNKNQFIKIVKE